MLRIAFPRRAGFLAAALVLVSFGGPAQQKAGAQQKAVRSKSCAESLDECSMSGCAEAGTPHALLNAAKRNVPRSADAIHLTFTDFEKLQDKADDLVGEKVQLSKAGRAKIQKIKLKSGTTVGEGDLVEVMAFLVGKAHANSSGESVNCRLKRTANNDFHIPVAEEADASEFEGIVVEMIPQDEHRKNGEWTIRKLTKIQNEERPVLIRGNLFYDNEHVVNDDEENPKGGQPKRFSLWEIHPVTEMFVCNTANKKCSPGNRSQWIPLEQYGSSTE